MPPTTHIEAGDPGPRSCAAPCVEFFADKPFFPGPTPEPFPFTFSHASVYRVFEYLPWQITHSPISNPSAAMFRWFLGLVLLELGGNGPSVPLRKEEIPPRH